jgi:prevent-host-death family protein
MVIVKTLTVTEFKAHCLEHLNDVSRTGESVVLTKHGRPTAMVVPPPVGSGQVWKPGLFRNSARITGDIVSPMEETWEALL